MSLASPVSRPLLARRSLAGVVLVADSAFTRSSLGMAFAAFGREVPVLYSGDSACAAIAGIGARHPVAAVVAVDTADPQEQQAILDLADAGLEVTVLLGGAVGADALAGLPVAQIVTGQAAHVQEVIGTVLGAAADRHEGPAVLPLPLSDMQRRVLAMFATGSSLTDIAKDLGVRPETVRTHLKRVRARYREVGVHLPSRRDLYQVARMSGLVA